MLKYRLTGVCNLQVIVSLDSNSPHKSAKVEIACHKSLVSTIEYWLNRSNGAYGHSVGMETTPLDLCVAMKTPPKMWTAELLEGEELLVSFDPGIPPGAIT